MTSESRRYTEREWDYLVHQGEWEWPDDWQGWSNSPEDWQDVVQEIAAKHRIPMDETIETREGTNLCLVAGSAVIKIFARRSPIWYQREVETLQALSHVPEARTPRLLAHGDAVRGDLNHPYLVMERLSGEPLEDLREGLSTDDQVRIGSQVAEMLQALHSVPVESLRHFGTSPAEWVQRIRERAQLAVEHLTPDLPPHLAAQLPSFLEACLPLVTEAAEPRLTSADIHVPHLLLERRDGPLQVSGHIDLGDAEVAPVEYEWVFLCQQAFDRKPALIHSFFETYGYPFPFSDVTKQQLKLYTLLHRFPPLFLSENACEDPRSLDEVLEDQWNF